MPRRLPAAALEQTRNMVDNIGGQVAASRTQDAAANYNLWVNPTYYTSNIDSPFAIDADIWGIEAGRKLATLPTHKESPDFWAFVCSHPHPTLSRPPLPSREREFLVMLNSFQHLIYFANKNKWINRIMRS